MQPEGGRDSRQSDEAKDAEVDILEPLVVPDLLDMAARRLNVTLHAEGTDPSARAAVARELRMMLAAIDARPKLTGDAVDELAQRRRSRRRRSS